MAVLMTLLRGLGRLLLGLAVLVALLYFLVISNLTQRLIDDQVYYDALNDTDAYNRIYDEVLVDEALREQTDNLLGDVQLKVHDEVVALLREILSPRPFAGAVGRQHRTTHQLYERRSGSAGNLSGTA